MWYRIVSCPATRRNPTVKHNSLSSQVGGSKLSVVGPEKVQSICWISLNTIGMTPNMATMRKLETAHSLVQFKGEAVSVLQSFGESCATGAFILVLVVSQLYRASIDVLGGIEELVLLAVHTASFVVFAQRLL